MEKKEQKSPHGWFIIMWIVFTLCIFLMTMVYTMDQEKGVVVVVQEQKMDNPGKLKLLLGNTTTSMPFGAIRMLRGGKSLNRHDKRDLVSGSIKHHLCSLPEVVGVSQKEGEERITAYSPKTVSLSLHGYEISQFSVGKNFYIYDCDITTTPDFLRVTILMELPEVRVQFRDHPEYSQYCPTINPYIHAVELVYAWGYNKQTLETDDYMTLSNLKIVMVPWEDNLYRKSYEQVKNSPLYKVDVPVPLNLKKEELYDFLTKSSVLNNIAMVFSPPITLQPIQNNPQTTPI